MYATGQQRSMALHPPQSTAKRTMNNAQYNNGSTLYGPNVRRNVNFQQVVENSSNQNGRNTSESVLSEQSPRTPFYPSFGSSFGNTAPSNNVNAYSQAGQSPIQQQHQQQSQKQQQVQHHPQHQAQSGMATGPVFGSRIVNEGHSNQATNTDASRIQNNMAFMSAGNVERQNMGAGIVQQQILPTTQNASSQSNEKNGAGVIGNAEQLLNLQQLNRHMAQLAGNVATAVSQNELVISLLERLVNLTENMAYPTPRQQQSASSVYSGSGMESSDQVRNVPIVQNTPSTMIRNTPSQGSSHSVAFGQRIQPLSGINMAPKDNSNLRDARDVSNDSPNTHETNAVMSYSQPDSYSSRRTGDDQSNPSPYDHITSETNVEEHQDSNGDQNAGQEDNHVAVSSLPDAFDDPLNFIGTPASTTHHGERNYQIPSSSSNSLQPLQSHHRLSKAGIHDRRSSSLQRVETANSNDYSSALTPHSGPPRSENDENISGLDDQTNQIPSPVFDDSMHVAGPNGEDDFSSFDLIMTMPTRRESRRISLRAQQQRKSLSQQFQAQQQQQEQEQQDVRKKPTRSQSNLSVSDSVAERNDESADTGEATSSPVRPRATRGRKRKAVLTRESLRSSSAYDAADTSRSIDVSRTEDTNEDQQGTDDSWVEWLEPRRPPPSVMKDLPEPKYKTIKEVRLERKAKTNRSLATIGRIPLKEYLEVGGDPEYRSVRRLARTVYNNWLEPNVRLAKQDPERLLACFHKIEFDFPILAECESHWKVRELMLQVIDNAIDEVAFHKRKEARLQTKGGAQNSSKRNTKGDAEKQNSKHNGRTVESRVSGSNRQESQDNASSVQSRRAQRRRENEGEEEDDEAEEEDGDEELEVEENMNSVSLRLTKETDLSQVWDNDSASYKRMSTRSTNANANAEWDTAHDPALLDAAIPGIDTEGEHDDHLNNYVPGRAVLTRRGAHSGMPSW